jgi:hypothetical protein
MSKGYQRNNIDGCLAVALSAKEQIEEALARITTKWKAYNEKARLRANDPEGPKK